MRLILVAGLLSGFDTLLSVLNADMLGLPPVVFAALAGLMSMAALVMRFVAQRRET